ncbi:MAG: MFS transporter [Acetobacteraceae bacterium]
MVLFSGLTALAFGIPSLLLVRLLFGAAEGPFASNVNKTVSRWFPQDERATALGLGNAGTPLGGAIAGPIVGLLAVAFGWRVPFVVIALLGLAWVAAWLLIATDRPDQNRWVNEVERRKIAASSGNSAAPATGMPFLFYLKQPAVIATTCAFFSYTYLLYFFLSWFPSYLISAQHLSVQRMSVVSAIPWLLGFAGFVIGGFVCDWLLRRTGNALLARKLVLVTSLLIAGLCVGLAGMSEGVNAAVALMAVSVFFMYVAGHTYWALILEVVEPAKVGAVGGFAHFIANLSGIIAPIATGYLVEWTDAFTSAFVLAGCVAAFGALAVAFFVRTGARLKAMPEIPAARPL